MKRALAAALLCALAACSSGGDSDVARPVAERTRATTSTTGFEVDPEAGFRRALESRVGHTGGAADAAVTMVKSMCDLLDTTAASDAAGTLSDAGLRVMFNEWNGSAGELAEVFVLGSENFCPEHRDQVVDYAAEQGISTRG
jgi:hypothetical protein